VTLQTNPVRYGRHDPIPDGSLCSLCAQDDGRLVSDHCHAHGWVRGVLCHRCNAAMAYIDRRIKPKSAIEAGHVVLGSLLTYAARCQDCPSFSIEELGPVASLKSTASSPNGPKTVRLKPVMSAEVRHIAERLGISVNAALSVLLSQALEARGIDPATGKPIPRESAAS